MKEDRISDNLFGFVARLFRCKSGSRVFAVSALLDPKDLASVLVEKGKNVQLPSMKQVSASQITQINL